MSVKHHFKQIDDRNSGFYQRVEALVAEIPRGKVMTFGQIAALCGNPRAARIVGGIAHFGNPQLPWQRVVKKDGVLAEGYPGGIAGHQAALESDGVVFDDSGRVNMRERLWYPGHL